MIALAVSDHPPGADDARYLAWRRAVDRRDRLERMFKDTAYLARLLSEGRYLRLCATFAWASANEERARGAITTDSLVTSLRAARQDVRHEGRRDRR